METKEYRVSGNVIVDVSVVVRASNEEEAEKLASDLFNESIEVNGRDSVMWEGNGDVSIDYTEED